MPNEDIDVDNLEALEKYRSFTRYFRLAEKESRKPRWWKTYRQHTCPPPEPKTDISLPRDKLLQAQERKERKKILRENRQSAEMERAARLRTVLIPLDEVRAEWEKTSGPFHKQRVAEHCGIFRDLFKGATFTPWVPLRVEYSPEDEYLVPVCYGNMVTPSEASSPPAVSYEADKGSLWTLLLTNPDGHLRDADSEYLHWLVTNIPGNDIKSGKEICHYLPPFPARGTGYHRFVFLLFKQDCPIDFSEDVRPVPCHSLKMRTFSTFDWYRKHEDAMTPAGLAFFQCQWDSSVTQVFHQLLDMREPVFELVRPPVYHPPQLKFPRHQPLRYLDRYRDTEEPTYGIY
ncbi:large ribosomal subunit protein mL38 isoform X2 [Strix aluco]